MDHRIGAKRHGGADAEARDERARRRDVRREGFRGPAADTQLGEAFLDALPFVFAMGFAADVSQCRALCGLTWRAGDRGATNDMIVQSLRLQCGDREAPAAGREDFTYTLPGGRNWELLGTTQLIRAAFVNNLPRVLQLLQLGAPLVLRDEEFLCSALHWACFTGREHVAKVLLDGKYEGRGASVDLRCRHGMTALMAASDVGVEALVRLLLSRGATQELQCSDGWTALHYAVCHNSSDIVALLCAARGAAAALIVRAAAFGGNRTPLGLAIHRGFAACEAVLRARGAPA